MPVDERAAVWARAEEIHSLGVDITRAAEKQADKIIEGDVYCITNPAWPGYVKIGEAVNAESRLRGYQTSGPFRDWKLDFAVHFEDRKLAEREILSRLDPFRVVGEDGTKGEWVEIPLADAKQAIRQLRSEI